MAIHSSILAWRTPGTEDPGGLQSMGSKESDTTEQLNHHHHHHHHHHQKGGQSGKTAPTLDASHKPQATLCTSQRPAMK